MNSFKVVRFFPFRFPLHRGVGPEFLCLLCQVGDASSRANRGSTSFSLR